MTVGVGILGISYYLPQRVETNEHLQRQNPDWRMEDLYEKSGIAARHIAADGETASDMGCAAATRLIERPTFTPQDVDYVIFCTQSPDHFLPSGACALQDRLGLGRHVGALDVNLGCSGFVYGLQLAKALIGVDFADQVLVITADTYSKYIHPRDRTVRTLFGDGAAATLVGRTNQSGIGQFVVGTNGGGAGDLIVPGGGLRTPRSAETAREATDPAGCTRSADNLFMDGPAIFAFAITTVPRVVKTLLAKAKWSTDEIDRFVYHQANQYMLQHLAKRSKIPPEKMVIDVKTIGNTVSASIPIALQRGVESGTIHPGHKLLLVGFGVGYSWAACNVTWEATS